MEDESRKEAGSDPIRLSRRREDQESLYAVVLANIGEGVLLIRASDGIIVYTNPKLDNMLGYNSGELIGKHISMLNAPTDKSPEETANYIIEALNENRLWNGEIQNIRKDGTSIYCLANVSSFEHYDYGTVWISIHQDITERKEMESMLIRLSENLQEKVEERTKELEETNIALRVLLRQREQDKIALEERVVANVQDLVMPSIEQLKKSGLDARYKTYLNLLESNLLQIVSPFLKNISTKYHSLTKTEIQIVNFTKEGKSSKEIAELLSISKGTVDFHKNNIRKKLGLTKTKTNLRTYLSSIE